RCGRGRFDARTGLHVLAAVERVAGPRLARTQDADPAPPVAQQVRLHADQLGRFADAEVELVGECRAAHPSDSPAAGGVPPFMTFFSTWLALNVSTRRPEMTISSPVCGVRPFRGRFSLTTTFPRPEVS